MDFAMKAMMAELAPVIRDFVSESMGREIVPLRAENDALRERLEAIEARQPEKGEKGDQGEPGQSGAAPEPEVLVDVFRPAAEEMIAEAVAKAIAELPPPEKGEAGERGADGVSPEPEAIVEAFSGHLKQMIDEAVAALPPAERGLPGEKGETGERGQAGQDGRDGADGRGVKDLLIDRDGNLVATMDDGEMKSLGPVVGKDGANGADGAPGNDGRDGFVLEDFDCRVLDDDRTLELSFRSGEHEHIATLKWPTAIYRGVFKEGQEYERGDEVTWAGSQWHCNAPTTDKPGTENWTLAVKKGRDGKDAKVG